jgi:Fe-S cluster assembly iron-binding protein IscA
MITVTKHAFSRLQRKLNRQPEGTAVRMTVKDGRVKFRPDTEQQGDVVISHAGRSVLFMEAETAQKVSRRTLDSVKTDTGKRLRFVPTA